MFSSRTNFQSLKAGLLDKEQLSSESNDMDSDEDLDEVEPTDIEVLQDPDDDYDVRLHPVTKEARMNFGEIRQVAQMREKVSLENTCGPAC